MYQGHLPRLRHPDGDLVRPEPKVPDEFLFTGTSWEAEFSKQPRYPVVRLDCSGVHGDSPEQMRQSLRGKVARQGEALPGRGYEPGIGMEALRNPRSCQDEPAEMLVQLLSSLQRQIGNPAVLVDEYDTPLLKLLGRSPAEVEPYNGLR